MLLLALKGLIALFAIFSLPSASGSSCKESALTALVETSRHGKFEVVVNDGEHFVVYPSCKFAYLFMPSILPDGRVDWAIVTSDIDRNIRLVEAADQGVIQSVGHKQTVITEGETFFLTLKESTPRLGPATTINMPTWLFSHCRQNSVGPKVKCKELQRGWTVCGGLELK